MIRLRREYASTLKFPAPPETFVHFSWDFSGREPTCYLRNYLASERPAYVKPTAPSEVYENTSGKVVVYRKNERHPVEDGLWWQRETIRLNREVPISEGRKGTE